MELKNALETKFQEIKLRNTPVLICEGRIDSASVPPGVWEYYIARFDGVYEFVLENTSIFGEPIYHFIYETAGGTISNDGNGW